MSEGLGPFGLSRETPLYLGTERLRYRGYAEQTERITDEEMSELCYAERRALDILTEHRGNFYGLVELALSA
jgi:hypothetical protein